MVLIISRSKDGVISMKYAILAWSTQDLEVKGAKFAGIVGHKSNPQKNALHK